MGSPYGWLLIRDWFSFHCILKEELGFKPSTVREVGLFLYNSWQTDPQTLTARVAGCPHRG
jgi:hypothetical protein